MADKLAEGVKFDKDKKRYDLIPPYALDALADVYTRGAQKYEDRNWEKGMSWGRIFGAIMRHLWAFWAGENTDKESGQPHVAHAAWGCFALLEYSRSRKEYDDRPKMPADVNLLDAIQLGKPAESRPAFYR